MRTLPLSAIILIAAGTIITLTGTVFKLQHWEGSTFLLAGGMLLQAAAIICFAVFFMAKARKTSKV